MIILKKILNRRILILIISIILMSGFETISNAAEYNLIDIYRIAIEKSDRIQIAEDDLYITQKGHDKIIAGMFPKLSATDMYLINAAPGQSSGQSSPLSVSINSVNLLSVTLEKGTSLGGAELYAYKMTNIAIDKSEQDLKTVKADFLLDVSTSFINILRAKKAVEINEANVERLKKHRDAAMIRLKVGEVIKTALLRAEAELSGAYTELVKAQNGLKLAKVIMASLIGITDDYSIIETQEAVDFADTKTIAELKQETDQNRLEIKSLELTDKILEQNVNIAKSSFWPAIALQLMYSHVNLNPAIPFLNPDGIYFGITASFPIFEGGLRLIELDQAEANRKKASHALSYLKKSLQIEIENLYSQYLTQKEVLKAIEAQVALAQDNYNLVSKQFDYGLVNNLEIMDANNLLSRSEAALSDARYNYQLILMKLKHSTGVLLTEVEGKLGGK